MGSIESAEPRPPSSAGLALNDLARRGDLCWRWDGEDWRPIPMEKFLKLTARARNRRRPAEGEVADSIARIRGRGRIANPWGE